MTELSQWECHCSKQEEIGVYGGVFEKENRSGSGSSYVSNSDGSDDVCFHWQQCAWTTWNRICEDIPDAGDQLAELINSWNMGNK